MVANLYFMLEVKRFSVFRESLLDVLYRKMYLNVLNLDFLLNKGLMASL